ncbi:MAG: cation diffusion facilitator family transporter [Alphaproteobacteria bacterium]|nr:cation diffusion facilitator family transporter [Alphaproteobacteria bacterium]
MPPKISTTESNKLKKRAAIYSICLATILILLKSFALMRTESLAIMSSMIDSAADLSASIITFWAVSYSNQPADNYHRYGHGKAEALSALIQAAFIIGSGIFVIYDGVLRLIYPQPIIKTSLGMIVMIISLGLSLLFICFQKHVAKKTNSQAIKADAAHYTADVATNLIIIVSLYIVQKWQVIWFDTFIAFCIAIYLLYNAKILIKDALDMLMDKELAEGIREKIIKSAMNCSHVVGVHDLRTRDSGGFYMIELHLEFDGNLSLYQVHDYTCHVENTIKSILPHSQVIIHQDPAGLEEERLDEILTKN